MVFRMHRIAYGSAMVLFAVMMFGGIEVALAEVGGMVELASPDGKVAARLTVDDNGRLVYRFARDKVSVLEDSPLGIIVDHVDLGRDVRIGEPKRNTVNERYPWRGVKAQAVNHFHGLTLPVKHKGGLQWTLEARAYDDGFAYRYIVPGEGKRMIQGEKSSWRLPAGSEIWYQTVTRHYEGLYAKNRVEEIKEGTFMGPPVTVELPGGGFAAITEGALIDYSGMTLRATGSTVLEGVFEDDPEGWEVHGEIRTPWRITMTGPDLNTLVNCDIVHNVCPPPDPYLFPDGIHTDWIKPGRAVWSWENGGRPWVTVRNMKLYNELGQELGVEYNLVDDGWANWKAEGRDHWSLMREVVAHAREHHIGVWVWEHMLNLRTPEQRRGYFRLCRELGIVGLKIDFINSESRDMMNWYRDTLRDAAEFKLMVSFHGSNKPTGEPRTWPNEMSRESVRGLEHQPPYAYYDTICPFTRLLAGHADTTPVHFGRKVGDTSWAHQVANAVIVTSPLLCFAEHPMQILINKLGEMVVSIPPVWDETIVLPISRIGETAAFARRNGDTWFLAVVNGPQETRTVKVALSFLGEGKYETKMLQDNMDDAFNILWMKMPNLDRVIPVSTRDASESLEIQMRKGGGFVARFVKVKE